MFRRFARTADADPTAEREADPATAAPVSVVPPTPAAAAALGTLADLPVAGLTRRRIALVLGALIVAWVVVLFARQVSEASAASSRAEELRQSNVELASDVDALKRELELIQRQAYITQQARAYRLGGGREVAFTLEANAPALPADAPGSASVKLGAAPQVARTPLESWLELLFGPAG